MSIKKIGPTIESCTAFSHLPQVKTRLLTHRANGATGKHGNVGTEMGMGMGTGTGTGTETTKKSGEREPVSSGTASCCVSTE